MKKKTGEYPIRRPYRAAPAPTKEGPRSNRDIRGVREVQLIDDTGANRGVVSFFEALKIAEDAGLDLVEIAPNSVPPVCKILDYGASAFSSRRRLRRRARSSAPSRSRKSSFVPASTSTTTT